MTGHSATTDHTDDRAQPVDVFELDAAGSRRGPTTVSVDALVSGGMSVPSVRSGRTFLTVLATAVFLAVAVWIGAGTVSTDAEVSQGAVPALDPTFVAGADPGPQAAPVGESVTRDEARAQLAGKPGVAMSMCNGMAKHFDETPEQVERAQRYADCLDGFGLDLRLPTSTLHQGYGIPSTLEPAVVLQCGESLTGPDVSPTAYADFERCADEAQVMFGLALTP